ncbi:MAG: hypothetical protein Tsb002_03330 [Wenzhouxiangellaceae bacterium]
MPSHTDNQPATLSFGQVPRLPQNWWVDQPTSDPESVWQVWRRDTYYLWGANQGNYRQQAIGTVIGGGGMAGDQGPTRGRYHPHYVGVITMQYQTMPGNDAVFGTLQQWLDQGHHVVVPTFPDPSIQATGAKFSLGTGIGGSQPHWDHIQRYLLSHIVALSQHAERTEFPAGTYWPDLRRQPVVTHPLTSLQDIQRIIDTVL